MTRVFTDAGETVPVTVIEALPNRVTQIKTADTDGYCAVQVAFGEQRASRLTKPVAGHYAKAKVAPGQVLREFRLTAAEAAELKAGSDLKVTAFAVGQVVDVTGTTMGKGFAGVIKRHHFAGGMATHGASLTHRTPGSIGQRQTPGRVFAGKRMSGHLGVERVTTENLRIVGVDLPRNLLLIRGAVPGSAGGNVVVRASVKAARLALRRVVVPHKIAAPAKAAPSKAAPAKPAAPKK
jgi:large subunit ribosomal protein L3